jgi:hypothetical protein
MHSMEELVGYLNNYFAVQTWNAAADLIGNFAISQIDASIRDRAPLLDGLKDFEINFTRSPGVEIADDNSVRISLPKDGKHRLKTEIELDVLPNLELRADFRLEILARMDPPEVNIDVDTNFHWTSNIAAAILLGPSVVATKRALEEGAEEVISSVMKNQLRNNINGLGTYLFDRSIDMVWHPDMQDPITLVRPEGKNADPKAAGYIDILLVADGFSQDNIGEFTAFADEVADHFYNSGSLEVPFRNFRSAIRIWRMPLVVDDPNDQLQRAAVPFLEPSGRRTMSFSNLARVAEIGLIAQETLWRDPIVVFTSREVERVTANAPGPYVLLDFRPGNGPIVNRAMTARKILIHELGHTPLGRTLADEHSTGFPIYRGPEPAARNVSTNTFAAQSKWQPWTGISGSMVPLANEGAYMHGEGIFRFQDQCRMRDAATGDFCPVCREQLALGMLDWGHYAIGGGSGWADVRFEYLSPWVETIERHLLALPWDEYSDLSDEEQIEYDLSRHLPVFSAGPRAESDKYPTRIRLTVVASSVPENWEVILGIRNGGRIIATSGISAEFLVIPESYARLIIRHGGTVPEIFSGEQAIPEFDTGFRQLWFVDSRRVRVDDLTAPTDLIQSVDLGARVVPVIDPANGSLSYPEELWLAATMGGIRTYTLPAVLEIKLEGPGNFEDEFRSAEGNQGERRRWQLNQMLPSGQYTWSARIIWETLANEWLQAPRNEDTGYCFEIGDIPFEQQPSPPAKPFDVTILETATVPSRPVGLAASSWHPNDKPIKFQFEVKKNDDAWNEQGLLETGYVQRDRSNYQTLAVTSHVPLSVPAPEPVVYKWRARAADPDNRMTDWVEGRPFALLTTGRPVPFDDWTRMLERLERFDHVLDPNGPQDSPRLFVDDGTIPVRRPR